MPSDRATFWKPSTRRDGVAWEPINRVKAAERFIAGKIIRMAHPIDLDAMGLDYDGRIVNGRGLCWWCRTELPARRRTWCSDECAVLYGWSSILAAVFKRDKGICCECGCDTVATRDWWRRIYRKDYAIAIPVMHELGWPASVSRNWWEADHIRARSEDGEDHPRNLRTLCYPCHKRRTKQQQGQWAAARRTRKEIEVVGLFS